MCDEENFLFYEMMCIRNCVLAKQAWKSTMTYSEKRYVGLGVLSGCSLLGYFYHKSQKQNLIVLGRLRGHSKHFLNASGSL